MQGWTTTTLVRNKWMDPEGKWLFFTRSCKFYNHSIYSTENKKKNVSVRTCSTKVTGQQRVERPQIPNGSPVSPVADGRLRWIDFVARLLTQPPSSCRRSQHSHESKRQSAFLLYRPDRIAFNRPRERRACTRLKIDRDASREAASLPFSHNGRKTMTCCE